MTTQPEDQVEGSIRSVDFALEPFEDDGFTLEGYAAVFETPTRINNSHESPYGGPFTETIARGAFARAVRANPKPKMQFDHGTHPFIGSMPIGTIKSMREDDKGLFISGRIDDNWLTEPVRDAIKSGGISGMSFRFLVPEGGDEWSDDGEERRVTDVDVPELGPVVWPAYTETTVSMRSRAFADAVADEPELLKDFSLGLLLANHRDELPDLEPESDPTPEPDESAPPKVADSDSDGVRVANPAKNAVTLMAVRLDQADQRSHLATHELSDR